MEIVLDFLYSGQPGKVKGEYFTLVAISASYVCRKYFRCAYDKASFACRFPLVLVSKRSVYNDNSIY